MRISIVILLSIFIISGCEESEEDSPDKLKNQRENSPDSLAKQSEVGKEANSSASSICESYLDHFQNLKGNHPVYFSSLIDSIVKLDQSNQVNEFHFYVHKDYLDEIRIEKLKVEELIYYCLKYPGSFHQICSIVHFPIGPEKIIFGYLPFSEMDSKLSSLQRQALIRRRMDVIKSLRNYIQKYPKFISRMYVEIMLVIDAVELFPDMIKTATENSLVNYTFLLETMKAHDFKELLRSDIYNPLYGEQANTYNSYIISTGKNRNEIIRLAKMFCQNEATE